MLASIRSQDSLEPGSAYLFRSAYFRMLSVPEIKIPLGDIAEEPAAAVEKTTAAGKAPEVSDIIPKMESDSDDMSQSAKLEDLRPI